MAVPEVEGSLEALRCSAGRQAPPVCSKRGGLDAELKLAAHGCVMAARSSPILPEIDGATPSVMVQANSVRQMVREVTAGRRRPATLCPPQW